MKLKNIKAAFFVTLGFSVVGTGCLKDKDYDNGLIQSVHGNTGRVISLAANVATQTNFTSVAYNNSTNDTVVNFLPVELSNGSSPAPTDIHVTIAQVDTLVDNYDNANGTDYTVPTAATIVNPVVTIPKGSYQGFLQIKFKPSDLIGQDLAYGFRITGVQESGYTISGNLKEAVIAIIIKNKYDGNYKLKMRTTGWAAYSIQDNITSTLGSGFGFGFYSYGAASLTFHSAITSDPQGQIAFTSAGSPTTFGAADPLFTFDLTSNKLLSVTNLAPDDGRGRNFKPNPAVTDSRYDPSTQTIYMSYIMVQNGRPDMVIYDTLSYLGPR